MFPLIALLDLTARFHILQLCISEPLGGGSLALLIQRPFQFLDLKLHLLNLNPGLFIWDTAGVANLHNTAQVIHYVTILLLLLIYGLIKFLNLLHAGLDLGVFFI